MMTIQGEVDGKDWLSYAAVAVNMSPLRTWEVKLNTDEKTTVKTAIVHNL